METGVPGKDSPTAPGGRCAKTQPAVQSPRGGRRGDFLNTPGVEPTNNAPERAIRQPVLDRRITQGTRSVRGLRWCERAWTVAATCSQQGRSTFRFFRDALVAYLAHSAAPSLLPANP